MEQENDRVGYRDPTTTVIKQGYLIKCHRGLVKAPKMQYFILTQKRLISFASKPDESTMNQPLASLSFKQLTSVKLDEIELNHCTLSCIQITSRTISSFLLAFSKQQERDEWMMNMLTAYSETLIFSRSESHLAEGTKTAVGVVTPVGRVATSVGGVATSAVGCVATPAVGVVKSIGGVATSVAHLQGIVTNLGGPSMSYKRRKTNRGHSLRRSKSCDDHLNNCTTNIFNIKDDTTISRQATSRKRKSVPDMHVISHFPFSWNNNFLADKEFRSNCFEHRDSLTLLSSPKQCAKYGAKTSFVSKILSMLEHSTRRVYSLRN